MLRKFTGDLWLSTFYNRRMSVGKFGKIALILLIGSIHNPSAVLLQFV